MTLDRDLPARFLAAAFAPDDWIAIAYRQLPSKAWNHRFLTAASASADKFLRYLRHLNAQGYDIYVSMNSFQRGTRKRTEANVDQIRHIYCEFDGGGAEALERVRSRPDLPPPTFIVHSSEGKFQLMWNVSGFVPAQAKALLRHLAHSLDSDPAVQDTNRVLRLPGFRNYKYTPAPFVRLEMHSDLTPYPPTSFPTPPVDALAGAPGAGGRPGRRAPSALGHSQSERDWANVRRCLAAGKPWRLVWSDLLRSRPDKPNARFYAALTTVNVLQSLGRDVPPELVAELQAAQHHLPSPAGMVASSRRAPPEA